MLIEHLEVNEYMAVAMVVAILAFLLVLLKK